MTEYRDDPRLAKSVYQPAADSYLLRDVVVEAIEPDWTVIDVGVGSGVVAAGIKDIGARVVGTDINPHACRDAAQAGISIVRASLLEPIARNAADAVTFNPPYLPSHEGWDDWLARAVGGGPTGAEVLLAWISQLSRVLTAGGRAWCIVSSHTGIERIRQAARRNGFGTAIVASRDFPFERLVCLRLQTRG